MFRDTVLRIRSDGAFALERALYCPGSDCSASVRCGLRTCYCNQLFVKSRLRYCPAG